MKCGEEKPLCKECVKKGRACVYVHDSVIFQSENEFVTQNSQKALVRRRQRTRSIGGDKDATRPNETPDQKRVKLLTSADHPPPTYSLDASAVESRCSSVYTVMEELIAAGYSNEAAYRRLSGQSIHKLRSSPDELFYANFFKQFLPSEQFISDASTWADTIAREIHAYEPIRHLVLAISSLHIGNERPEEYHRSKLLSLMYYQKTIVELQKAIYDGQSAITDECLISASLLGVFEMLRGQSPHALDTHMAGCLTLMRMKGPKALEEGLVNGIFVAHQAEQIRRSLDSRQRTYFSEPEWVALARKSHPIGFNKFVGTELNVLLLRLTDVIAVDGYDPEGACALDIDIQNEREIWFSEETSFSGSFLESRRLRARILQLATSPFGDSIAYDTPYSGTYILTIASIQFDGMLLHLHSAYNALQDNDYQIASRVIKCCQYIMADEQNCSNQMAIEMIQPLLACIHHVRSEIEVDWILHCLKYTGVEQAYKYGKVFKQRMRDFTSNSELRRPEKQILDGFLTEVGLEDDLITEGNDDTQVDDASNVIWNLTSPELVQTPL